ncbi:FG-GAP-like repeat-containing protein [Streptomyces sp. NPDC052676]|uniref:FG-GAP-like repeat-containing protein n=1 Tax=Streptomyces sp. NPDC052676 TaxID=3154953 RepID=UPI00342F0B6D
MRPLLRTAVATALALGTIGLIAPAERAHAAPTGTVHTIDVPGADPLHRAVSPRTTRPFSMIGVTWDDPHATLHGTAEVRTRSAETGEWSGWQVLDTDVRTPETGPDHDRSGVRGGTQPLWTGPSDGVQVRVSGRALPRGLRVELVDPDGGASPERDADTSALRTTAAEPTAAPRPAVTPRSGWGADESMVQDPPTYTTDTKAVFVHHTAGTNDYTCAESASIVRGIFTYHVQSNGWNDIGYHFLVDKCGTVFEGRAGGIDKPVLGAHTYGFNTDTSSISVLGDYNTATTNTAVRESVAKVAAWKLGLYGVNPSGTVVLTAAADNGKYTAGQKVTLNRISGHRDGYPTECPGRNLYADLPAIRALAANANKPAASGDVNREGHADLAVGVPRANQVSVVPGATPGPYGANKQVITQESTGVPGSTEAGDAFGAATAHGDLDADRDADLAIGAPGEGATDAGAVTLLDGTVNALAPRAAAVSPGVAGERFGAALASGDFDGDGDADLAAVAPGGGRAYPVDGRTGALGTPLGLADGPVEDPAAAAGDFDRDGYTDLAVTFRTADGATPLVVARGSAAGLTAPTALPGTGGRSLATGDLNGDGYADLAVGRPAAGEVGTFHGSADGLTGTGAVLTQGTGTEAGDGLGTSVAVGDTDADGYADVLAGAPGEDLTVAGAEQADAGAVTLFRGGAGGATESGAATWHTDLAGVPGAAEAGDRLGSAVALADVTGDGHADLGIGSSGENAGDGTVLTLNSGPAGVIAASGLYFGPGTLAVPAGQGIGDVLSP